MMRELSVLIFTVFPNITLYTAKDNEIESYDDC